MLPMHMRSAAAASSSTSTTMQLLLRRALSSSASSSSASSASSSSTGLASGAPETFVCRSVRILHPARTAMQQGYEPRWRIEFDPKTKWLNPLMGWTSSDDTTTQLQNSLRFASREDAIRFAEQQGFDYEIVKPHTKVIRKKSYSDNYKWRGPPSSE